MNSEAPVLDIDPETLAILREVGIDPQIYLKRQVEMRARKVSPEEAAKLAAEQEALRPALESCNRFIEEHGLWADGLRPR